MTFEIQKQVELPAPGHLIQGYKLKIILNHGRQQCPKMKDTWYMYFKSVSFNRVCFINLHVLNILVYTR